MKPKITVNLLRNLVQEMDKFGQRYIKLHGGGYYEGGTIDSTGVCFRFDSAIYYSNNIDCWCGSGNHDDLVLTFPHFVRYLEDPDKYFERDERKKKNWEKKKEKQKEKEEKLARERKLRAEEKKEKEERELYKKLKEKYGGRDHV